MATYSAEAWKRLGALLRARRVALDPSYRHRTKFCAATGLDYRVVFDIEQSKRENFALETLILIEAGYALQPGAITRVLNGAEDLQVAVERQAAEPQPLKVLDVSTDDGLVLIPVDPDMSEAARTELKEWGMRMARYLSERDQGDNTTSG